MELEDISVGEPIHGVKFQRPVDHQNIAIVLAEKDSRIVDFGDAVQRVAMLHYPALVVDFKNINPGFWMCSSSAVLERAEEHDVVVRYIGVPQEISGRLGECAQYLRKDLDSAVEELSQLFPSDS